MEITHESESIEIYTLNYNALRFALDCRSPFFSTVLKSTLDRALEYIGVRRSLPGCAGDFLTAQLLVERNQIRAIGGIPADSVGSMLNTRSITSHIHRYVYAGGHKILYDAIPRSLPACASL